jgi:hypothetical protein
MTTSPLAPRVLALAALALSLGATRATRARAQEPTPATPAANGVSALAAACAASTRCFDAGPFLAEVANVTPMKVSNGRHHALRVNLRVRNVSDAPLVLGYKSRSSAATDEHGNPYHWGRSGTHDVSARGIGVVTANQADPQFVLRPGEARTATFELTRFNVGRTAIGTTFGYDLTLVELEPLPGSQVRSVRDYSVSFQGLRPGPGDAALDAGRALLEGLRKAVKPPK